jgi:hypothetical protein
LSDKDFKVKNKLVVNGLTGGAGPLIANSNKEIDSAAFLTTLQGGTGTTTSPAAGQVLYSAGGTSYNPTALNTLDVKGATYSADAPSSPVIGQIWVESDTDSDSFDPNIIRRKSFTATAAQTTFTTDVPFIQGYEQVFFNGMLLVRNNDYTTTNDTTVVLTTGAAVNDVVEVVTITNLNSINAATTTTNTFTGVQTIKTSVNASNSNLKIINDGTADSLELFRATSPGILTRSYNGTYDSPTAGTANQRTGFIIASSYDGSVYANNSALSFWNTENTTSTARGSHILFETTAIGGTSRAERMRIMPNGKVTIGTSSIFTTTTPATGKLTVISDSNLNDTDTNSFISLRNKNNTNATTVVGGILSDTYRDVADPHYSAGMWFVREPFSGNASSSGAIVFGTGSNVLSGALPTERMRITSEGNMLFRTVNSTSTVRKIARTDDNLTTDLANISMFGAGANNFNGAITFNVKSGGFFDSALIEAMRVNVGGNVLINNGASLAFNNPINTGSGSIYCAGGGSLTLASYNQPMITLHEDSEIRFFIGTGTQRAVINSSGELLVGYTSDNGNFRLQVNGQIFATSSSISTSDGRYKENVSTIESGLEVIDMLRPVSFNWKEHPKHDFVTGKTVGFIAQEVQESLSDYEWIDNIIKTNVSAPVMDEEGNEIYPEEEFLGIAEGNLIPLLVAAVKELKARVETLEAN